MSSTCNDDTTLLWSGISIIVKKNEDKETWTIIYHNPKILKRYARRLTIFPPKFEYVHAQVI